jgi:hypothetical protein
MELPLEYRANYFSILNIIVKTIVLFLAILGGITTVNAQKLMAKNVPEAVINAFIRDYPSVVLVDWSQDGNNFEAKYDKDQLKKSATYNALGEITETEEEMAATALPAASRAYIRMTYNEEEIKNVSKVTSSGGTVTYIGEVKGNILIFDAKGAFVKAVKK